MRGGRKYPSVFTIKGVIFLVVGIPKKSATTIKAPATTESVLGNSGLVGVFKTGVNVGSGLWFGSPCLNSGCHSD